MLDTSALKQEIAQELEEEAQSDYPDLEPAPDREAMLLQLDSQDMMERIQAARAFCELVDARATPKLLEFLQSDCPLLRVSAAYALGRNHCPDAVPLLLKQLDQDWNDYVRKGIVWALGTTGDRRAFFALEGALVHDTPAVRLWSASGLGQLGDPRAIGTLSQSLLNDPIAAVQGNCAWALGKLLPAIEPSDPAYRQGLLALQQSLSHEDVGVQDDVRKAMLSLGISPD